MLAIEAASRRRDETDVDEIHKAKGALTVQFRVQFLDVSAAVIKEMHIDAHSVAGAIELVAGLDWPAGAVRIVILDEVGVEVHSQLAISPEGACDSASLLAQRSAARRRATPAAISHRTLGSVRRIPHGFEFRRVLHRMDVATPSS